MFTYSASSMDDPLNPLRHRALDTIGANAVALDLGSASDDGTFQVALGPLAKRMVMRGLEASGADKGFDRTIGALTNGSFSPQEIKDLESRVLDKAEWTDVHALHGIQEGVPVNLTPKQKTVIDGLMGKLGDDPLARRARDAYGRAVGAGNVRSR